MSYCPECGTQVNAGHKFCPGCGMKLEPVQMNKQVASTPVQAPVAAYPPPPQEQIRIIIPNLNSSKGWGRYETFNLVVTDRISIFSKLTNEMMSKTIQARRARAGDEGKGFFGKWRAQMQGFNNYIDYYDVRANGFGSCDWNSSSIDS